MPSLPIRRGTWLWLPPGHPDREVLKARLVLPNPQYRYAEAHGYDLTGIPPRLVTYVEDGSYLGVPRNMVVVHEEVVDETVEGEEIDYRLSLTYRPGQEQFVADAVGVLLNAPIHATIAQADTGFGKSVSTLAIIAALRRPAVILVHKEFLMDRWMEEIRSHLGITPQRVQQNAFVEEADSPIALAMIQTLTRRPYPEEWYRRFGLLVVDEVHHLSATTFYQAATLFPAKYRLGLSATPRRKDGLDPLFRWHIGPVSVIGSVPAMEPDLRLVLGPPVPLRGSDRAALYRSLARSAERNRLVSGLAQQAAARGRKVLVLTHRRDHVGTLVNLIRGMGVTAEPLVGGLRREAREANARAQVIVATYQLVEEAFDLPDLDALILATPLSDPEQAIGRVRRWREGKRTPIVVDVVDRDSQSLALFQARKRVYLRRGWFKRGKEPASA